jgi:hypothetical protein
VLERNSQLVWVWDWLSLTICQDWAPRTARDVPTREGAVDIEIVPGSGPQTLMLAPWPFRSRTVTVHCDGRRLEGRFESERELRAALAKAPGEVLELEFLPGSDWRSPAAHAAF